MGIGHEIEDHFIPLSIFTYPEIASIGLNEKEARAKGAVKIGRFPFRSNPTAVIAGETDGSLRWSLIRKMIESWEFTSLVMMLAR